MLSGQTKIKKAQKIKQKILTFFINKDQKT